MRKDILISSLSEHIFDVTKNRINATLHILRMFTYVYSYNRTAERQAFFIIYHLKSWDIFVLYILLKIDGSPNVYAIKVEPLPSLPSNRKVVEYTWNKLQFFFRNAEHMFINLISI